MSARAWVERAIVPDTTTPTTKRKVALHVYLPDDEYRAQRWLRRVLGSRVKLTRVQHRGVQVWQLSPAHLIPLAGALADSYGVVKIRLEILAEVDRCDTKCRDAKATSVWECVCSCAGEHHGGYGIRSDWYQTGRSTLKRYDKTQIDQLIVSAGLIPVRQHVPRPAPIPKPAPVQPPRPRPRPTLPPQQLPATPPIPAPAPVADVRPPAPIPLQRPVPAAAYSTDTRHAPGDSWTSHRYTPPETPTLARNRRGSGVGMALAVAAAGIAAVVVGISAVPHHPAAHPTRTSQVGIPEPVTQPQQEPSTDAPTTHQFPPGCYPLQQGC
ncbi:hypothetical protein [Nocardia sp. NPDC004860]|uniref:hypothetical protein n=1 Tax=Nocardia sp. NPDC004860 TaxID=3154557 RepID=UPI0033B031C7